MPRVLGVEVHSEAEKTPRSENILRIIRTAEQARLADHEQIQKHEKEIEGIKEEFRKATNRTMVMVASIGLLSAVTVALIGYWGQIKSIELGAQQGKAAGVQVVQSARPSTEATYLAGFSDGAKATIDEQLRRLRENPPPIASTPDRLAGRAKR